MLNLECTSGSKSIFWTNFRTTQNSPFETEHRKAATRSNQQNSTPKESKGSGNRKQQIHHQIAALAHGAEK